MVPGMGPVRVGCCALELLLIVQLPFVTAEVVLGF